MPARTSGGDQNVRPARSGATRERILDAAERLFAEHGVYAVSNRQVGEAAGQGNNTAVSYHFGGKADLVRAIARRHTERIDERRERMVAQVGESEDIRSWVACLVHPLTEHLATATAPTWFARFSAQVMTDPALHDIMVEESLTSPSMRTVVDRVNRRLPDLPAAVRAERDDMTRLLLVHTMAERERALAEQTTTPRSSWHAAATGLVDSIVGIWLAPVTSA